MLGDGVENTGPCVPAMLASRGHLVTGMLTIYATLWMGSVACLVVKWKWCVCAMGQCWWFFSLSIVAKAAHIEYVACLKKQGGVEVDRLSVGATVPLMDMLYDRMLGFAALIW